ncbi:O-antigen ligase family protein [Patescibacteria group bacterium]|nr:O-antigen ligase family protein [Patescibacteria group bacterium]
MKNLTQILLYINFFFLQSYLIRFSLGSYPTNLQEILIGIAALSCFAWTIKEGRLLKSIRELKKYWVIWGFVGLSIFTIATNQIINNLDLIRHLKFLFFAIALVLMFFEVFRTKEEKIKAFEIAGKGALVFGIFSAVYNLMGYNITHDFRLLGPLDSAVYLAFYLTPFMLFFLFRCTRDHKKQYLIYAILLAILIAFTRSMGAIGGSFATIAIYFFTQQRFKTKTPKYLIITGAILISALIFYTKILPTIQTNYSSLDERGEIWQVSTQLLKENLVTGLGLGQFQSHYAANAQEILNRPPLDLIVLQPHNIFLLFYFQFGFPGLIFLLYLIYTGIKKTSHPSTTLFIALYFLIHGLIDTPLFKNDLMILFILILTLALNKDPKEQNTDHPL